jgi:nitrite reductase/ring-hydroxylating ferredoxin subunit
VTFAAAGAGNCVQIVESSFVYARTRLGEFVLMAQCPHRGGPLHLAGLDPAGTRLVCPWHGRATSVSRQRKLAVPAVRRGCLVTAVLPGPPGTPYEIQYRPLSADLGGDPAPRCASHGGRAGGGHVGTGRR